MLKIAVIADFLEEEWPSMDLCAEHLAVHLSELEGVQGLLVRPPLRTTRKGRRPAGLERALGRFVQLPAELLTTYPKSDYYHIADHSYGHLALLFPRARVGVYCHDIDAYRACLPGSTASRSRMLLSRLLLKGLRHARIVFYSTQAVREEILKHALVPASRLIQAPFGVADEFLNAPTNEAQMAPPYLLHVGSCIPRKNVEFLLVAFAAAKKTHPELRLLQVGGRFTDAQQAYIDRQELGSHITQTRGISRDRLAKLYAGATVVLVPSLSEGFGLPIIEALGCGSPVIASDIPVLREVGFQGVRFCPLSSLADWLEAVQDVLTTHVRPGQETRDRIRSRYTWRAHAEIISNAYVGDAGM
jgi:glycosyltransferase involved in cell wall biosynthesis